MSKPNKFTKSIMERLEQEQEHQKLTSVESKENLGKAKKTQEEKPVAKTTKKAVSKKASQPKLGLNIESIINKPVRRKAKNKTFYLDEMVIETLQKEANRLRLTDSKLANEILKSVLEIK